MKNKVLMLLFVLLVAVVITGCSSNEAAAPDDQASGGNAVVAPVVEDDKTPSNGDIVGCGEIYSQGEMSYSIIGARIEEVDGEKQLVLKMEAYNSSDSHFSFSPLMNAELTDSKGNEGDFEFASSAYQEDLLDGLVLAGGNKIMGELVFSIDDTESDEFILQLGSMMGKEDAIRITADDLGKTYAELFENTGVVGEYTIGDTIEFEDASITFDGVRIEPKNTYKPSYAEEGMELMVIDMTMVNNSNNSLEFVSVSNMSTIRKVCAADGTELKYEDYSYTNRNWVESGETKSETFGLYFDESVKDFYLILTPDVFNRGSIKVVTFSIE